MEEKSLDLKKVLELISLPKTSFYGAIKNGIMPKPVKIGRSSKWKMSKIQEAISKL